MAATGRMMLWDQTRWRLPVVFWLLVLWLALLPDSRAAQSAAAGVPVRLYFPNERLNPDHSDCSAVFPIERQLAQAQRAAPAQAALRQLLAGPTADERAAGYHSLFSAASADLLKRLRISGGTAYVDLVDFRARLPGSSSSCGAAEFRAQIERTLLQFKGISRVRYAIEGDPRPFHDWMGEPCGQANGYCNPRPFRVRTGR